jgi:hypothetical protein
MDEVYSPSKMELIARLKGETPAKRLFAKANNVPMTFGDENAHNGGFGTPDMKKGEKQLKKKTKMVRVVKKRKVCWLCLNSGCISLCSQARLSLCACAGQSYAMNWAAAWQ